MTMKPGTFTPTTPPEFKSIMRRTAESKSPDICQWFLLCENPATTTKPHKILGDVPCCARCADWVERMSA